jgi:hypothetical protein
MYKRILCLLLIGFLFSMFTLSFGYCAETSDIVPFSYDELSGQIEVTSPVENYTYPGSDIVVNASLYIGGREYEQGTHYVPYQNISCVYSLDGSEWQNMSFVSAVKTEPFPSPVNKYWYSSMWINYTATLHNVSKGTHYLKVDVHPKSIPTRDIGSSYKPLVHFNVIVSNQPSTELNITLIIGLVIVTTVTVGSLIYVKKVKPK